MNIQASNTLTGSDYSGVASNQSVSKSLTYGTAAANAAANGANECASFLTTLAGSASASLDLTSLTNIMQVAGISLARVKALVFRVLSVADDATNGSAATSVTIDSTVANSFSSQSESGWFNNAHEGTATGGAGDATGSKMCLPNGSVLAFATPSAAGILVDGTHKIIKITNVDTVVSAKVQLTLFGGTT